MKANKAPDKIYVDSKAIREGISTTVHTKRQNYPTCTEYTRADAFVEKACSWLENNLQGIVGGSTYIDDFRKYMKGE